MQQVFATFNNRRTLWKVKSSIRFATSTKPNDTKVVVFRVQGAECISVLHPPPPVFPFFAAIYFGNGEFLTLPWNMSVRCQKLIPPSTNLFRGYKSLHLNHPCTLVLPEPTLKYMRVSFRRLLAILFYFFSFFHFITTPVLLRFDCNSFLIRSKWRRGPVCI